MGSPASITYVYILARGLASAQFLACSYGPIFIGVVFNIVLYGIMITQTYLYYNVYKRYVTSSTMPGKV